MAAPMDPGTAAVLGAVQGLTEFLPVSSSGHVAVGALAFGIPDMSLSMVVALHLGTLIATIVVFRRDLGGLAVAATKSLRRPSEALASDDGRLMTGIVVASIPTALIGLLLNDHVESLSHEPWVIGACLLVTAAALLSTRGRDGKRTVLALGPFFLVGVVQGLAVMPGISRSGSTIAVAMLLGMRGPDAFRFSFLLSLPAVTGAVVLKALEPGALGEVGMAGVIGGAVALVTGYGALLALRHVVMSGRFWVFAVYLIPLGTGLILWQVLA